MQLSSQWIIIPSKLRYATLKSGQNKKGQKKFLADSCKKGFKKRCPSYFVTADNSNPVGTMLLFLLIFLFQTSFACIQV